MNNNPLFAIDFYKVDHRRQYPEGTTEIYSNFTARYVKESHSLLPNFDNKVVVFGLQHFIVDFLIKQWNEGFFKRNKSHVINEYKTLIQLSLGIENFDCSHFERLHDLGYLPIKIKAISEGSRVPIGVPVLTIVNTNPEFFWLTNYLETILSASLWKPMTSATIAYEFKRLLTSYAIKTGASQDFVPFQAHDFSFRGMSGLEDATLSGAAHLTSFVGTDCVNAIDLLQQSYEGFDNDLIGMSVPATEHSVMCCNGVDGEFETIKRLISEVYPSGIVSIVSDSYDFWHALTDYLPKLKSIIMNRSGKVVIRPDSGDPIHIICGHKKMGIAKNSPQYKGALECLWDIFGGTINEVGYKELDSHIGLIYGDAITVDRAKIILDLMEGEGFASSNIVFGVGSYTYQYVTRDTFGFAMKATSAVINDKRKTIFKDPITADGSKKSAKGLLCVDLKDNEFILYEDVTEGLENTGALETVFENGKIMKGTHLSEIRAKLNVPV